MKKILVSLIIILMVGVNSVMANNPVKDVTDIYTTEYAQEIVAFLTQKKFQGREAGKKASLPVIKFLEEEFAKIGCSVSKQPISSSDLLEAKGEPKKGTCYPDKIYNVIGTIEGKDPHKIVIVGAHFDHLGKKKGLGIHPGADDNASGIVALLSLAKMVKATGVTPEHTIMFCAWDGEEKGLLGSRFFVYNWYKNRSRKDSIIHYMNFDMVGRTATPEHPAVTFAWNNNYPYLLDICKNAQKDIQPPFNVILDERKGDGKGGSDYAPFSLKDIPFIAWMEDKMHEDYHKPTDTPDKIHWEKLKKTTLLAYKVLEELVF
ncbi:MAG: M20/M25/M40 family metallo-hydrolase [Bacteroidia bacterium]|nr:M20/M25/M40 family metallo-hydrolase [Bacteroidia bacterium]